MHLPCVILIDGENLALRYKSMLKAGHKPRESNTVVDDCFVWSKTAISQAIVRNVVRAAYYTTVQGDDAKVEDVRKLIAKSSWQVTTTTQQIWTGTLVPYVYKKIQQGMKTKSVDINLTIDALKYAYGTSVEQIIVVSGDGDFIPLYREIMSRGKMLQVWALSDGLNPSIQYNVDDLDVIDSRFFED